MSGIFLRGEASCSLLTRRRFAREIPAAKRTRHQNLRSRVLRDALPASAALPRSPRRGCQRVTEAPLAPSYGVRRKMATNGQVADTALSEEAFFTLFLMVEENECLWRIDHEGYKNVHNKDRIWKEICRRLQERFPNLNALKPGT